MTPQRGERGDAGNAMVEFVFLGVLLFIPLVYVVVAVFDVQRAGYAASTAVREAGRAYVTAESTGLAEDRAEQAARLAFSDQGMDLAPGELRVSCSADPCLTPGAVVTVTVATQVPLPLIPTFGGRDAASVAVSARHDEVVDAFRSDKRSDAGPDADTGLP